MLSTFALASRNTSAPLEARSSFQASVAGAPPDEPYGPRWWLGLSGVVSVLAGVVAFWYTGMTTLVLLMFIAAWAVIIGATQIWGAIALRSVLQHEWLLILNGALSIAFGVILMVQPGAGALAVAWMIAWYAIFFGCLYIALAFRLRQYKRA
jgi:uncharacterized membrane protein HdeD (DUF308 family)